MYGDVYIIVFVIILPLLEWRKKSVNFNATKMITK